MKQYINDINELHRLPKKIIKEHPRGYVGVFTEGPRRIGKTVFNMKTAHEVFQFKFGLNRDDAWKMVLDNMLFDLADVDHIFDPLETIDIGHIDKHWQDEKPICKIWDDVGMHGGKYRYLIDAKYVDHLQSNLDIMGIVITGFLMNAPEIANVLSFLRDYHDHTIIRIGQDPEKGTQVYERVAIFNTWRKERIGWRLRSDKPHTPFSCFIGDADRLGIHEQWVYDEYEKMKVGAIVKNRLKFKKMIEVEKKMEKDKTEKEILDHMGLEVSDVES
jgi:hypothetical protein